MGNLPKLRRILDGKTILLALGGIFVGEGASYAKFDGFYVGGSLGYLHQNTNIDAKQDPTDPNAHVHNTHAQRGVPMAELFLGWGKLFGGCFYGGIEGKIDFIMAGSRKVAEDTNFMYLSGRKGSGIATLVRLGYLITPQTMIYGGVGVKVARFEHNLFEKADKISALFSKRSLHLLTEVGLETSPDTIKNMVFRLSYSFKPNRYLVRKTTDFPGNHIYRDHGLFKAGTTEQAVKVGIAYRF